MFRSNQIFFIRMLPLTVVCKAHHYRGGSLGARGAAKGVACFSGPDPNPKNDEAGVWCALRVIPGQARPEHSDGKEFVYPMDMISSRKKTW